MKTHIDKQVLYNGRWVDKEHFAVFVYNSTGERLVKNYTEYQELITSGIWFASKADMAIHLAEEETQKSQEAPEKNTESKIIPIKGKRGKNGRASNIR